MGVCLYNMCVLCICICLYINTRCIYLRNTNSIYLLCKFYLNINVYTVYIICKNVNNLLYTVL